MAGFNINEFRSKVGQLGVLKSSSVMVNIFFGSQFGLRQFQYSQQFGNIVNEFQFSAEATNLPGVSLATTEIRRHGYGVIEKKPYVPIFTDINVVFRLDQNAHIYSFFQTWMKMIINFDGRGSINSVTGALKGQAMYEVAYKDNYMSTVGITMMDQQGKEPIKIILTEAYPIFLGDIPLAWQATNDYVKVPVRFTFKDWYLENVNTVNDGNLTPEFSPQPFGSPLLNNN